MTPDPSPTGSRVLVTGVTGYVGGRLVPELLDRGHEVRVLSRSLERIRERPWLPRVETVEGDAGDPEVLAAAHDGIRTAYYLIHAMGQSRSFEERDRRTATAFARSAERAGVGRVVYLGGIVPRDEAGEPPPDLSPHLRSRTEVGRIFLESSVPTAAIQAAVVIGSGSVSFEMLRYLTERLPVMVAPSWVRTRIQPIAIRDVLWYLAECPRLPPEVNRTFDLGGTDVLTYEQMMQRFAVVEGLPRRMIVPVPVLTPRLSSYWVGLVTPVPSGIAKPLVASLRYEVVCAEDDITGHLGEPPGGRLGFDGAVTLALQRVREANVTTRWASASVPGAPSDPLPTDPEWAGGSLYVDERSREVATSRDTLWSVIEGIGGDRGWYSARATWRVRGLLDRLVGGVGLRRGRRDPDRLQVGDTLDWWRVEAREPGELLRLRAEMRLPGLAWLEFRIEDVAPDGTADADRTDRTADTADADRTDETVRLVQRALFHPRGLAGQAYWWGVRPFHGLVFGQMITRIARAAERGSPHPLRSRRSRTRGSGSS
ncbi:MAG TPA: SDR family oxidoreductase [Actinopolymorphaceae bacterium]|nr:SDR family oxidoreductase [Actinopolymorphaceae bacterium]